MNHATSRNRLPLWTKAILAAILILCLMATTIQAAAAPVQNSGPGKPLNADNAAKFLDSFFSKEQVKSQYAGAGASVIIVKDGETVLQKGFGYADSTQKTKVDPAETVFRMASVSKTFTATAVMQLVEQGKIKLQEDFRTYTGPLEFDNPFSSPVTVEQLLTHTTGFQIQDPQPEDIHADLNKYVSIEEYVKAHMPPVVREPGSSYMYDNFASLLLGLIVEKVSGEPFEQYMSQQIFKPLNMTKSGFLLEGQLKADLATAYDASGKALDLYTVTPTVMPHGGMLSTAADIGRFMKAFLNGGTFGGNRILSEASVAAMEEYRSSIHPLLPNTTYGFEAAMQLPEAGSSSKVITKAGDLSGFSTYMFLIPEQNTGVFIAYNKQSALRNLFYPAFINEFFPQYAAPAQLDPFQSQPAAELARYTGYYADLRLGSLVSAVSVKNGALTISDALLGSRVLRQVDDNLFIDELTKQFTAFQSGADGQGAYLKEPYLNPLGYAKRGATAAGFADVTSAHPYAAPVMMLQSLGYLENDAAQSFEPERGITRAEYVRLMLVSSSVKASKTEKLAFSDLAGHPDAGYVQMGFELGMLKGSSTDKFQPDRVISRQEAAVMLWRLLSAQYPEKLFAQVKLAGQTDKWAAPAVKMMVAFGLYGPEVQPAADGTVDFHSRAALTRQENAVILYTLFTTPIDQIAAQLTVAPK